jgi:pullulanase/glycogen debranching enzyme
VNFALFSEQAERVVLCLFDATGTRLRAEIELRWQIIAEPWGLGEDGYQVGNFPVGWTE